jgi:hypothetical protein
MAAISNRQRMAYKLSKATAKQNIFIIMSLHYIFALCLCNMSLHNVFEEKQIIASYTDG